MKKEEICNLIEKALDKIKEVVVYREDWGYSETFEIISYEVWIGDGDQTVLLDTVNDYNLSDGFSVRYHDKEDAVHQVELKSFEEFETLVKTLV